MKRFLAALATALIVSPAMADDMTFSIEKTKRGNVYLAATGTISDLSPWLLASMLSSGRFRDGVIVINSPGGDVAGALALGRLIREYQLTTIVPADSHCYSACAFAFLGGVERVVGHGAELGMHQFRWTSQKLGVDRATNEAQNFSGELIEYFEEMGVSTEALVLGMRTPADDMYVFGPGEMKRYRITFDLSAQ